MTGPESDHDRNGQEWLAQERAARAGNYGGAGRADADALDARYRLIARLLAEPKLDPIPPDFARRTAELARQDSAVGAGRLEKLLERGLWAVLALAGVTSLAAYAGQWHRMAGAVADELPAGAAMWAAAIGGCLLLTVLIQAWAKPARPDPERV